VIWTLIGHVGVVGEELRKPDRRKLRDLAEQALKTFEKKGPDRDSIARKNRGEERAPEYRGLFRRGL